MTNRLLLTIGLLLLLPAPALAGADDIAARGLRLQARGSYDRAVDYYSLALESGDLSRDNQVFVLNNRGRIHYRQDRPDQAVQDFSRAIELNPAFMLSYLARGTAWEMKGELDRAIRDYTRAIELRPGHAGAWYNRGRAWYLKEEYHKAIQDLSAAVERSPEFAGAYLVRGYARQMLDQPCQAKQDLEKARELDPLLDTAGLESDNEGGGSARSD